MTRKKVLTDAEERGAANLYMEGKVTLREVQDLYNIGSGTLTKALRNHYGWNYRDKHPRRYSPRKSIGNPNIARMKLDDSLRSKYGITVEDYERMHNEQGGVCVICQNADKLVVDHDHITGKVRGLLCHNCNLGLGHFKDNALVLRMAIGYLLKE